MVNKSKFWQLGVPVMLAVIMICGVLLAVNSFAPSSAPIEVEAFGLAPRPLVPYATHYYVNTTVDHWAILVGLTDASGYPHAATNALVLKSLQYAGVQDAANQWEWNVGVVVTATADGAGIEWIASGPRNEAIQFVGDWEMPEHGLSLRVGSESLMFVQSNQISRTTSISSGMVISSTKDCLTGTIAAGDLILFLNELTGESTMTMTMDVAYEVE